jgi:aminopeptidase N
MLRADLGPELYRKCIKTYLDRHQHGNVVTDDLAKVFEELAGRSYDKFFDQWVYHAHYPELNVEYSWNEKAKLAKVSVKQNQKLSEDILLFDISLPIIFKGAFGKIDKAATASKAEEDFYFALPQAPKQVLIDPEFTQLAKVSFENQSSEMLKAQIVDADYVGARLTAIEKAKDKKDHDTISLLKKALNNDSFYGARVQAAKALQAIHLDESLDALIASTNQTNARVRQAVVAAIAGFYNDKAYAAQRSVFAAEKNPDIIAADALGIGLFHKPETHKLLVQLLNRKSFRGVIADGAIKAMRSQDDPSYIAPISDYVTQHQPNLETRSFAAALEAVGYLGRNETNKDVPREFLLKFVVSKKKGVQLGAIRALGLLEDPKALGALETFANSSKETEEQPVAEKAIADIRAARRPTDNLKDLRTELLEMKKASQKMQKELDEMKKKSDASRGGKTAVSPKRKP